MEYKVEYQNTFPILEVKLEQGEKISCERGSMITMSQGLELKGTVKGGFISGIIRKLLTRESFFTQNITATKGPGTANLGASIPGTILPLEIKPGFNMIVQKGSYLANTEGIELSTKMQGIIKGLTSKEGFFLIRLSGSGTAFINALGAAKKFELGPGEELVVDNGHLLAWDENMNYVMTKSSTLVSSLTSGEGLVCRFTGPGNVYIHTISYSNTGKSTTGGILNLFM